MRNTVNLNPFCCCLLLLIISPGTSFAGEYVWVEGEKPVKHQMNRHAWWYDQVKREHFSGGDFISNFDKDREGTAEYAFNVAQEGDFTFWVRANPLMSKLSYTLNGGKEVDLDLNQEKRGELNVAADDKPDLRFLAWSKAGHVELRRGTNTIRFRMSSENNHHGYLDCFVFSSEPFQPKGLAKPDQLAAEMTTLKSESQAWFDFDPPPDSFQESPLDLRFLNERFAGEHGHITVRDGQFVRSADGQPVRFWGVNGPPHNLEGEALRTCARMLAKRGVNLVRIHGGNFSEQGEVDLKKVKHAIEIVHAMKAEGIYSLFSIYFPLWLNPQPGTPWLEGYDGKSRPFAALMFNQKFQEQYRKWWTALLTSPSPDGATLASEPAVAGLEMQNEDSFFFWTFSEQNLPEPQLLLLEKQFGDWLTRKHGSLAKAVEAWKSPRLKRDAPESGRMAFRPLWAMFNEKTIRDQDTAAFLLETQAAFYAETYAFLRKLGYKGPITASNWSTASPEVFGPLEKLSYTEADFLDRHGYFSCNHKGENAEWSIRVGHTYADRSAYRFDAEQPGKPRQFVHHVMDIHYAGKPSMISETTWNRPNRFRSEAPVYFAAYGALQGSDSIVHFALDGAAWAVKPGYWTQPWTLMSPAMMGQFPAAALIYRRGLVTTGKVVAQVDLSRNDLLRLKGTPLPQEASLDELRLKDLPSNPAYSPGARLDPLLHFVGRTEVNFTTNASAVKVSAADGLIDQGRKLVTSSTRELKLDYNKGVLTIDAPAVQGASGCLAAAGSTFDTADLTVKSQLELGHIIAVALDGKPLSASRKILLQVMSEEKPTDFSTEPGADGVKRIANLGRDPWVVKKLSGSIRFKRPDAAKLRVTPLDANGYPAGPAISGPQFDLKPATLYYFIAAP